MIQIKCLYVNLTEILDFELTSQYTNFVNPIDYEFDLERNVVYKIVGIVVRDGAPWVYATIDSVYDVQIYPAVLFEFSWQKIPNQWLIRINSKNLEILPKSLADIDNWYEQYIDENEILFELIEKIINT